MKNRILISALALAGACVLTACGTQEIPPAMRPLSKDTMMLLGRKGMKTEAPIFIRIFKEESELEVWKARDDGRFYHFKTYPICNWSGDLGPKLTQGDKQAPEGFYTISRPQMNPNSGFHLSFNLGYPNSFDRAHGRTGNFLMVHGKCRSAGCYAMTDALIEEIYALAREQFAAGHENFQVHAYPFRMTPENMARHANSRWIGFWGTLKQGYDHFETTRQPPEVAICERRYHVNARPLLKVATRLKGEAQCPRLEHPVVQPFTPASKDLMAEAKPVIVPGPKMRTAATLQGQAPGAEPGIFSGLIKTTPAMPKLGFGSGN